MKGTESPFPPRVAITVPLDARTTVTVLEPALGTQMLAPSKTGVAGVAPTGTACAIAPSLSSLKRIPESVATSVSVIQMLVPSKTMPYGLEKPSVTVVTGQGRDPAGVTIETEGGADAGG